MASWAAIAAVSASQSADEESTDLFSGKYRVAVADATALIKGISREKICDVVVTVQEVLNELRDKQTRAWLQSLPYTVRVLDPQPDSVKTVVRFARDTGDLPFLSLADVKILALAFEMEKRIHGMDHLRLRHGTVISKQSASTGGQKDIPGWGNVKNPEDWRVLDKLNEEELNLPDTDEQRKENLADVITEVRKMKLPLEREESETQPTLSHNETEDSVVAEDCEKDNSNLMATGQWVDSSQVNNIGNTAREAVEDGWHKVPKKTKKNKQNRHLAVEMEQEEDKDEHGSNVSCLTGDFGIQNVLLQMGINLFTPDGLRIRQLSSFGMKCASCFKVTRKSERVFCHNCGNSTLYKVRIEIGEHGMEVIGGKTNPPQRRGAKCSIPPPKGGKKNKDAIVSEDAMHLAMDRHRNLKKGSIPDIMAPEYNEDSWFKTRVMKNEIKDQLPGRFGYPRAMSKYVPHKRK